MLMVVILLVFMCSMLSYACVLLILSAGYGAEGALLQKMLSESLNVCLHVAKQLEEDVQGEDLGSPHLPPS